MLLGSAACNGQPDRTPAGQVPLGILAASLLMLWGCAAPTPLPTLSASIPARSCLLHTACSGLFDVWEVRKAPILDEAQPRYWIAPDGTTAWETVIREPVMPTLAAWTAREWREVQDADDGALQWHSTALRIRSWGWTGECETACAVHGDLRIVVRPDTGHPYFATFPDEMIYRTALHEALHALWYAEHSETGLMCSDGYCRDVEKLPSESGFEWWTAGFPDVLHEVYTLYAALPDGMDLNTVLRVVQGRAEASAVVRRD